MRSCPDADLADPGRCQASPRPAGLELAEVRPDARVPSHRPHLVTRQRIAWLLGTAGLLAYNWWILVPLKPGLLRSPGEFYSNLEVTGQPYATAMQHADLLSGLLILTAFVLIGSRSRPGARREWTGMIVFAAAGAIGGIYPQVCADGISPGCFSNEWHFRLPLSQYLHDGSGIVEFTAITLALLLAVRRTNGTLTVAARTYRGLFRGALVGYPLLGIAYLWNTLGAVMEGLFFTGFTVMILTQLAERTRRSERAGSGLAELGFQVGQERGVQALEPGLGQPEMS